MKNYTITVNGNVYDVTVEEGVGKISSTQANAKPATSAKPVTSKTSTAAGAIKVNAPMPGKILKVNTSVGQAVKKGDVLMVLEAMKMENEIQAPKDGVVASLEVVAGDSVESGKLLVSLN